MGAAVRNQSPGTLRPCERPARRPRVSCSRSAHRLAQLARAPAPPVEFEDINFAHRPMTRCSPTANRRRRTFSSPSARRGAGPPTASGRMPSTRARWIRTWLLISTRRPGADQGVGSVPVQDDRARCGDERSRRHLAATRGSRRTLLPGLQRRARRRCRRRREHGRRRHVRRRSYERRPPLEPFAGHSPLTIAPGAQTGQAAATVARARAVRTSILSVSMS